MIVDDMASCTQEADVYFRQFHIIRIPFAPKKIVELCPKQNPDPNVGFDWAEVGLPYDKLLIVGEPNAWAWAVESYVDEKIPKVTRIYVDLYASPRGRRDFWVVVPLYYELDHATQTLSANAIFSLEQMVARRMWASQMLGFDEGWEACKERLSKYDPEHERKVVGYGLTSIVHLLACRNIRQEPVIIADRLNQARARRGRLPLYRYHILKIVPSRTTSNGRVRPSQLDTAMHWVRGHFKRYTHDQKLFGKHTGIYWWHPHMAGTSERVVEKQYRLDVDGG